MDESSTNLVLSAPLLVTGLLLVGLGARGLRRQLTTAPGPWWARLWAVSSLLPATGVLLLVMGALFALGFLEAVLVVMYVLAAASVVALGVVSVRAARAGDRRRGVWTAAIALLVLTSFMLILLGWHTASNTLLGVLAGGFLALSAGLLARRWRSSSPVRRRSLMQLLALAVGLSCQAAARLLPPQWRTAALVLEGAGLASLLLSLGMLFAARRHTPSSRT